MDGTPSKSTLDRCDMKHTSFAGNIPHVLSIITTVFLVLMFLTLILLDERTVIYLNQEDGVTEWTGALCFLSASWMFLLNYLRKPEGNDLFFLKTRRNLFMLCFALLFFFAFGEEISWGQRIFGFQTPETLMSDNIQHEFNIHNLRLFDKETSPEGCKEPPWKRLFNFNFLFNLFCLVYCGAVPLINKMSVQTAGLARRINLPIVPVWLGVVFILSVFSFEIFEWFTSTTLKPYIVESKECTLAFLFLMASIHWYYCQGRNIGECA